MMSSNRKRINSNGDSIELVKPNDDGHGIKEDTSKKQIVDTKKKGLCSESKNCWKKTIVTICISLSVFIVVAVIAIAIRLVIIPKALGNSKSGYNSRDTFPKLVCYPRYAFTPVCLGDTLYCNCTVISGNGYTQWKFSSPSGTNFCLGSTISLKQMDPDCANDNQLCGSFYAENLPPVGNSLSCHASRLTIQLNSRILDGVDVICRDTITDQLKAYRIEISGAPLPPKIISLTSAMYNQLSVTWVKISYTDYYVSINKTSTAGEYLRYDMHPYTYTFTGLENNTIYNVSIVAINCNGNSSAASVIGRTATCPSLNRMKPSEKILLCPADTIQYTCTFNAVFYNGNVTTLWNGSAFHCPELNNSIILIQAAVGPVNTSQVICGDVYAAMFAVNETCYTSVLTIIKPIDLNGSIIECYNGRTQDKVGSEKLIQQFKVAPNTPNVSLNTSSSELTVNWTPDPNANSYNVSVFATDLMKSLSNITSGYTFHDLKAATNYSVSVTAINCAGSSTWENSIFTKSSSSTGNGLGIRILAAIVFILIVTVY